MELCVLPQTGSAEPWMLVAVVAVVLIAAGVALVASGRARRSVLTGLSALAIIGALVAGGIGGAAPAQADAGSTSCVTAPAGDEVSAATLVAPGIPTAAAQCAAEPTVQIPSTQGVTYTQDRAGSTLTVTAVPAAGYAFVAGATTTWTFDMTATSAAPWPVELPERTAATPSEPDLETGGSFLTPSDAELVPALQAAADAGALTYALDASQFAVQLEMVVIDPDTGEKLAFPTLSQGIPSTLTYDFERGAYLLGFDGSLGELDELEAQYQALLEQYPGTEIVPRDRDSTFVPFDFVGMQILASYSPGAGCETATAVVPIDLVLPREPLPLPRLAPDVLLDELTEVVEEALEASPEAAATQSPASGAPASDAPATEVPVSEAPATEAPVDPSETDAAPASDEEVVEPTTPADER